MSHIQWLRRGSPSVLRAHLAGWIVGGLLASAASSPHVAAQSAPTLTSTAPDVPLVAGLLTVSAVHDPDKGDYESILRIDAVSSELVSYVLSSNVEDRRLTIRRGVRVADMAHAHGWRPRYNEGDPEVYPGMTGGTFSSDVLAELKTTGQTSITASMRDDPGGGALGGLLGGNDGGLGSLLGRAFPSPAVAGHLQRVEPAAVPVPMIVNDRRVDLPTVHVRGTIGEQPFEAYVLDNPAMPMLLRWNFGGTAKRMVKIAYPLPRQSSAIAERLTTTGRAEVYGIYFDSGKSTIRPESEPVLHEIADVMSKHPAWTLSVEGHTDNIGSAASNLDLSSRRAAAVRDALASRYHVDARRLVPAGFGASRPKETNDTLEGRARNRRVELVRQGSGQ